MPLSRCISQESATIKRLLVWLKNEELLETLVFGVQGTDFFTKKVR